MAWPTAMPVVAVEWVDSTRHGGWDSADTWERRLDEADNTLICRSVGWLLRDTDKSVIVVQSQSECGSLCDMMEIPKAAVRAMRVLEAV